MRKRDSQDIRSSSTRGLTTFLMTPFCEDKDTRGWWNVWVLFIKTWGGDVREKDLAQWALTLRVMDLLTISLSTVHSVQYTTFFPEGIWIGICSWERPCAMSASCNRHRQYSALDHSQCYSSVTQIVQDTHLCLDVPAPRSWHKKSAKCQKHPSPFSRTW